MNQLIHLKESSEEKKRYENQLKKTEADLAAASQKLEKLTKQLKKEFTDVQKLEEQGLTSLFYGMLGSKEKKIDKERQEYLAAKLKYNNCKNEINALEYEIESLKTKIFQIGTPEAAYKNLLEEKKKVLVQKNDKKYVKYEELLELYFSEKKELKEAIAAGEKATQGLRLAIRSLKKAKNWGTFDMLGGGLVATAAKHSNIDDAENVIRDVQVQLQKFRRELSDVRISAVPEMGVQLDSFMSFADYFFDNLIFDWVVQSKINRSLDNCEQMYSQVSTLVSQLRDSDQDITQKYKSTKTEFTNYIESV